MEIDTGVFCIKDYKQVDGDMAIIKKMTVKKPILEYKKMEIAVQMWKCNNENCLILDKEVPIHQLLDMMMTTARIMIYFKESYQYELFYDPDHPIIETFAVQGSKMTLEVELDHPHLNKDIIELYDAFNHQGFLIRERMKMLLDIMEDLEL